MTGELCNGFTASTSGVSYNTVWGKFRAYQVSSTDAFGQIMGLGNTIEVPYVDGISITYGAVMAKSILPRKYPRMKYFILWDEILLQNFILGLFFAAKFHPRINFCCQKTSHTAKNHPSHRYCRTNFSCKILSYVM